MSSTSTADSSGEERPSLNDDYVVHHLNGDWDMDVEKLFKDAFEGNQTLTGAALRYKVKTLANIATNRLYNNWMEKKKDDYGRITYTLNVVKPQDPVQSELPF